MKELLESFCIRKRTRLKWMRKPFNAYGRTWATDGGYVIIGVPAINKKADDYEGMQAVNGLLATKTGSKWFPIPDFETKKCENHEEKECDRCGGTGIDPLPFVEIGGISLTAYSMAMLQKLPGIEICPNGQTSPARIRFDGDGIGYVMPVVLA